MNDATPPSSTASAELASFGTDRKRLWILKFEDADRGDMHFDDEGDAHHAYENFSAGWNCTLLETAARKYEMRCGQMVPLTGDAAQGAGDSGAVAQHIKSIADDCREDFNTCPQCGYEDHTAIKNSNLLLLVDSALEQASTQPLPAGDKGGAVALPLDIPFAIWADNIERTARTSVARPADSYGAETRRAHIDCLYDFEAKRLVALLRTLAAAPQLASIAYPGKQPVTDAMCEVAIGAFTRDRIQGFSYKGRGEHVIRDVWLSPDKQEIWTAPIAGPEEYQAFQRQCGIERMRKVLEAAYALPSTQRDGGK